jgi:two-component system sensor histidine kinase CreC
LRDVEEIELAALADEVVEDMKPVFSGKRIDVSVLAHNPAVVRGERFLIRQAAANLLQNAIDFSNEGGRIAVSVENRGDFVEMVIVDSGPGVPNYARDKVFDRFYSLRRPDTGKKSSGLGLAFAREAAELHGGRVSLDNRPEGGAKARLLLPVRPQPATL